MGFVTYIIIFVVALGVLLVASDKFIESAEKIGLSFGISPFIIGVTIVAFGTSLPELATSIASVYSGSSEIVVGNVIGSNITNILLVLGLTAVVGKKMDIEFDIINSDLPMLIISSFLFYFIIWDQNISLFEAGILFCALMVFLLNSFQVDDEDKQDKSKVNAREYFKLIVGGVLVYFGAKYTIFAIEEISKMAMISPDLIALTCVAIGTSLPELIVSVAAVRRGKHAIALGNVLGSNLFNTLAVVSIPRFLCPLKVTDLTVSFGAPFMVAVSILFLIVNLSKRINQCEGFFLLLTYAFFIYQLVQLGIAK